MAFPAGSRSMLGEGPRIPHLGGRRRSEIGDLRHDVDEAFARIEGELDNLLTPSEPATVIPAIQTEAVVTAALSQTIRVDPTSNPQTVNLPSIEVADAGRLIEVKEVGGGAAGSLLTNLVTIAPSSGDTVDGQSSFEISMQRGSVILRSDGASDWMITGAYLPISAGASAADHHQTDQFTATALQTAFVLSKVPADPVDVVMHVNGQRQRNGVDFSIVGTTVTWLDVQFTLSGGDAVQLDYDF